MSKKLRADIIFAAAVLAAAAAMLLLRGQKSGEPLRAELIYGDDNTVLYMPLDENKIYDVDTGYLTVHIEITDGGARFINSPCPDRICEGFGLITEEDQTATCLPARAVLTIAPAG